MAYDIGPKIGIDGEAEFRQAINNINTNIRTLGTEMLAVTSAYDANDKSAAALTSRNEVLVKQIDAQKEKLSKLREGLAACSEKYGDSDEKTQRWQQTVNKAVADLNKMERELQTNNDALDGFGNAAEEAADSTGKLESGLSAATVAIGNLVSSGVEAAVGALTDMVSTVWNLDEATEEYRAAQGKLQTAFEAAGHSTDAARQAYTGFYKILGDTDTAAEASQLLAQLAGSEEEVVQWTEIAAGVAGTFGDALPINGLIEAANETSKVGQVTGALADALNWVGISEDDFNEKLSACGTESERNQIVMEALSATYADAADAFYRNNESIVQARESQALLDEALSGLGETVASVKNGLQADFLPAVASLATAFSDVLSGAEGADEALANAIGELIETAVDKLPEVVELGASVLTSVLEGLVENLPELADAALELITTLADGIADSLPELIPTVVDVVLQIVETLTDPDNLVNLAEAALELITALAEGLVDSLPSLAERVPEIIVNIVETLTEGLPQIAEMAGTLIVTLAGGLIGAIPDLAAAVPELVTAIVDGFDSFADTILDIGINIVSGVWKGISEKASWLKEKVTGFFDGIVGGVLTFLGINSPSRLFREQVGQNIALGVAEGISDKSSKAVKSADKMAKDVYSRSKDWADKQTKYMGLTYDEQIELWETIQGQFITSSRQYSDAQEKIYDLRQKKLKASAEAEKAIMSELEDWTGDMEHRLFLEEKNGTGTVEDTIAAYRAMQERVHRTAEEYRSRDYAENSDEIQKLQKLWWSYEDAITKQQEDALKERTEAQKKFVTGIETIQKDLEAIQDKYLKELDKRTEEIANSYRLFDKVPERNEVDGQELIDNLAGQITSIRGFYSDLDALSARGVGDGLVEEIRQMGVGASGQLDALLRLTDSELTRYAALYGEKQRLAGEIAGRELEESRTEMEAQLQKSLDSMGALMDSQGPEMGKAFADGIAKGLREGLGGVTEAAIAIADAAAGAVRDSMEIASPSKVFARLGGFMAEGLGEGFGGELGAVERGIRRSMAELAGNASATARMDPVPVATPVPGNTSSYEDLRAALRDVFSGAAVYMDGKKVGRLITSQQSNETLARGTSLVPV